ncbi:hypothetical protein C1H46_013836 [Malus baccata]|uniref:Putative gamma-glutamylcyclotransferase n=1 Tax=Malus baccata TaxID=106549 RepID=A0A540MPA5_MALBA|nr:hypothetical protein C1H46_013836 [Malus baccata]
MSGGAISSVAANGGGQSQSLHKVFVYGSLMAEDVCRVLLNRVLVEITDPELHILDEFEDVEYERSSVEVSLMDSSESLLVQAYVWSNKNDPNLYGDWNFEEWKQLHMKDFVKMTSGFMEELELPEAKPRVATYELFFQQDRENPPVSQF